MHSLIENESHNQNPTLEILFFTSPFSSIHKLEKRLMETIERRKLPIKVTKIDVLKAPEVAEEHNIIVCPTLIFGDFMKVCGNCKQEELDEILSSYFSLSTLKFQQQSVISSVGEINHV